MIPDAEIKTLLESLEVEKRASKELKVELEIERRQLKSKFDEIWKGKDISDNKIKVNFGLPWFEHIQDFW